LFMPIIKFVYNIIIFSFLLISFVNANDGIVQFDICDVANGSKLQTQKGYDPRYWHGFDILHTKVFNGEEDIVAFIEYGACKDHVQFQKGQVTIIDCSQREEISGEDRAIFRIGPNSIISEKRIYWYADAPVVNKSHGTHVMGVALGQPMRVDLVSKDSRILERDTFPSENDDYKRSDNPVKYMGFHPGGCCPKAQGYMYTFSDYRIASPSSYQFETSVFEMGTALFSFQQFIDLKLYNEGNVPSLLKRIQNLTPPLNPAENDFFKSKPVDGSVMAAFREALKGPGFVISCSFKPFTIMDPTNKGLVPIHILDELATLAEENDKIFIWAAGNDAICLEKKDSAAKNVQTFFQQLYDHPVLSKRTIIAVNAYPTTEDDPDRLADLVLRGKTIRMKLHPSSNYPGNTLKSICLSAVGSSILSGYGEDIFQRMTGTSQAAPIIASLATLVHSKAKKEGLPKNGLEVIDHLKKTALPIPDPKFGCGYVWAPVALGIEEDAGT
jgi:hypothetical protein